MRGGSSCSATASSRLRRGNRFLVEIGRTDLSDALRHGQLRYCGEPLRPCFGGTVPPHAHVVVGPPSRLSGAAPRPPPSIQAPSQTCWVTEGCVCSGSR